MAPEQAKGLVDVGPAADVWSLGCVLYEVITGRQVFAGSSPIAIRAKVLCAALPPIASRAPEAPAELVALVEAMLRKDPAARPTTARVIERLHALPPIAEGPRRVAGAVPLPATAPLTAVTEHRASAFVFVAAPEDDDATVVDQIQAIAAEHGLAA